MGFPLAILACACAFVTVAIGVPSNVTVDDQSIDPTSYYAISYSPNASDWSAGQTCTSCEAQPDAKQAHGGTWSDTTYDPADANFNIPRNATFKFTGTAFYAFGIQSHSTADPVSGADMVFYIDGVQRGAYTYTPTQTNASYTYNQLLFSIKGLTNVSHVFTLQNGQIGGPMSLVLFDYLIYTQDNDISGPSISDSGPPPTSTPFPLPASTPSSRSSPTSSKSSAPQRPTASPSNSHSHGTSSLMRTVIACIVTAVAIILLVLLVLACRARRRRRISNRAIIPGSTRVSSDHIGAMHDGLLPDYPAPSYYSASYRAASPTREPTRRLSEKTTNTLGEGPSALLWRGVPEGDDDSDAGEGRLDAVARGERGEIPYLGSSIAGETLPPSYRSEEGVSP